MASLPSLSVYSPSSQAQVLKSPSRPSCSHPRPMAYHLVRHPVAREEEACLCRLVGL